MLIGIPLRYQIEFGMQAMDTAWSFTQPAAWREQQFDRCFKFEERLQFLVDLLRPDVPRRLDFQQQEMADLDFQHDPSATGLRRITATLNETRR